MRLNPFLSLILALSIIGCDDADSGAADGTLTVFVEAESVIQSGLAAGDGPDNIADGWSVDFEKYVVAIGALDLHRADDASVDVEAPKLFVVDLTQIPTTGLALWQFDALAATRWIINYAIAGAKDGATRDSSVDEADFEAMRAEDWTYLIQGTLSQADGISCPPANLAAPGDAVPMGEMSGENPCYAAPKVEFVFGTSAKTTFGPCEIDGVSGVSIPAGGTQTVALTIHGDHLFFNGFPEGDEGGVTRLAQWLADCDLNLDGMVTNAELAAIAPSALPALNDRFQLGGSPITPLNTMADYVRAQLKTQGHFQGEGECPVDGVVGHD